MAQLHLLVLAVSPSCLYEGKVSGAVSSSFRFGDAPNPPFPCREGLGAQEVLSIFPLVAGGEVADRVLFRCSVSKKETHQVRTWGGHGELQKAASSSVLFLPHPPPVHFPKRAVIQHGCGAVCAHPWSPGLVGEVARGAGSPVALGCAAFGTAALRCH